MISVGKYPLVAIVTVVTLLADQLTKLAVWHWLKPLGHVEVISGLFNLIFVTNTGVAFGMMSAHRTDYKVILGFVALLIIIAFIVTTKPEDKMFLIGLSMVSGGAVGNLIDRVRMGAVIDFLEFHAGPHYWPAFNVADIAITIGTGLVMIHMWKHRKD